MNKNLTEIAFILDRSGSMQPLIEAAMDALVAEEDSKRRGKK